MAITAPRGTADIMPTDALKWEYIENTVKEVSARFGFKQIRTPVFEHTELFERGVGDTTDVVQKEMYTFNDKGGRSITLRPEGTAGVARAFLEHNVYAAPLPAKLFYNITCYRYEKPQAGRLREFHQFGAECFGTADAAADAEMISYAYTVLRTLGLDDTVLYLNSIGCPECRKKYNTALREYFKPFKENGALCETCRGRYEKNPLRILDCKCSSCADIAKDAPQLIDYICDDCRNHFEKVKSVLDFVNIPYKQDTTIVRGLDYYTKTVFEFKTDLGGAAATVCGGGRYDGLVEKLGGAAQPAIGFAMGIERLILALESKNKLPAFELVPDVYIAIADKSADIFVSGLVDKLRGAGIKSERDICSRSLKAQMKYADKCGARYSIVIGGNEIETKTAVLKNMKTKEQHEISIENINEITDILTEA